MLCWNVHCCWSATLSNTKKMTIAAAANPSKALSVALGVPRCRHAAAEGRAMSSSNKFWYVAMKPKLKSCHAAV